VKKPEWMKECEGKCEDKNSISLHIFPKNEKYEELAKKALRFLNSVICEEGYD
jgi:hypothetical protein